MNKSNHQYIYYGTKTNTVEVEKFMLHMLETNKRALSSNRKKKAMCIWGRHGIGKTELVEDLAKRNGYDFTYIAPAQFEEMGDLLGMPKIEGDKTVFLPPSWVPTEDKPGILLIDDVNRADDRILRGIMQLLQNYELASWKLPPQWHIILTANPDGGDYSVTPMDDAMLTRMLHITMEFDIKAWASWAGKAGVDERGINFALTYPEIISGDRTTPRSLVQFFDAIAPIKDLNKELALVTMLADSCLDTQAVATFIAFVKNNLSRLISPEEIVNAKDFKKIENQVLELFKDYTRMDLVDTICTRLILYVQSYEGKLKPSQVENIKSFLKIEHLPNDTRLAMIYDAMKMPSLKSIVADPYLSKVLLQNM